MPEFKLNNFSVTAKNAAEANQKMNAVTTILKHLTVESLTILAAKAGKPNVNALISQFSHLI